MTQDDMPGAIARALPLMDRPENLDTARGYLDLLGERAAESSGPVQDLWSSTSGSALYDSGQALVRKLFGFARLPESELGIQPGGRALDVGCGPGGITGLLGRRLGRDGLALGVDVSVPMLRRAVRVEANDHVGFLRADARKLPFHDGTFDVVTSVSVLQLIPDPLSVLDEMGRLLVPGGRMALLIPTVRHTLFEKFDRLVGHRTRLRFFDPAEIAERLHENGFRTVHTRQHSQIFWVLATKTSR